MIIFCWEGLAKVLFVLKFICSFSNCWNYGWYYWSTRNTNLLFNFWKRDLGEIAICFPAMFWFSSISLIKVTVCLLSCAASLLYRSDWWILRTSFVWCLIMTCTLFNCVNWGLFWRWWHKINLVYDCICWTLWRVIYFLLVIFTLSKSLGWSVFWDFSVRFYSRYNSGDSILWSVIICVLDKTRPFSNHCLGWVTLG